MTSVAADDAAITSASAAFIDMQCCVLLDQSMTHDPTVTKHPLMLLIDFERGPPKLASEYTLIAKGSLLLLRTIVRCLVLYANWASRRSAEMCFCCGLHDAWDRMTTEVIKSHLTQRATHKRLCKSDRKRVRTSDSSVICVDDTSLSIVKDVASGCMTFSSTSTSCLFITLAMYSACDKTNAPSSRRTTLMLNIESTFSSIFPTLYFASSSSMKFIRESSSLYASTPSSVWRSSSRLISEVSPSYLTHTLVSDSVWTIP